MAKKSLVFVLVIVVLMILGLYYNYEKMNLTGNALKEGSGAQVIISLEKNYNSHGGLFDSVYGTNVNYDEIFNYSYTGTNPHKCDGNNTILVLTNNVNAHAEKYDASVNYTKLNQENNATYQQVCYGDLICSVRNGNCAENEKLIVAMESEKNSHLSLTNNYNYTLATCCRNIILNVMNASMIMCERKSSCMNGEYNTLNETINVNYPYSVCCKEGGLRPARWLSNWNGNEIRTAKIGEPVSMQVGLYVIDHRATNFSLYKNGNFVKTYASPHNHFETGLDAGEYYFKVSKNGEEVQSPKITIGGGTWNGTYNCGSEEIKIGNPSHDITKSYQINDSLKGWINVSFKCTSGDYKVWADFSSFSEGNRTYKNLATFLNDVSNVDYTCMPRFCQDTYIPSSPTAEKSFNMGLSDEQYVGMQIGGGDVSSISKFGFTVESNAVESCKNPFEIDLLNDNSVELIGTKASTESCGDEKNYGCGGNLGRYTQDYLIGKSPYCEVMNLSIAPAFELGAYVRKGSTENPNIVMSIYDGLGDQPKATCALDLTKIDNEGEVGCVVNYSSKTRAQHYVCIYDQTQDTDFAILGELYPLDACGFSGWTLDETKGYSRNYQIYSIAKKFTTPGEVLFSSSSIVTDSGLTLEDYVLSYIKDFYYSDCSKTPCVIPIKIKSNVNQKITLNGAYIEYTSDGGRARDFEIYTLKDIPPLVNTNGSKIIELTAAGIEVPDKKGNYDVSFRIGNKSVFSDKITVESFSSIENVTPSTAIATIATTFTVGVNAVDRNITKYEWKFEYNSSVVETFTNTATYTYLKSGTYELEIKLIDSAGKEYTGSVEINVLAPTNLTTQMINERKNSYDNLKSDMQDSTKIAGCYKDYLIGSINLDTINNDLKKYQDEYNGAIAKSDDEAITKLFYELIGFRIPYLAVIDGTIDYTVTEEKINGDLLSELFSGTTPEDVGARIVKWNEDRLTYGGSYRTIAADYNTSTTDIVTYYDLKLSKKINPVSYESYLVIDEDPSLITFCGDNYNQEKKTVGDNEFYAIKFSSIDEKEISFIVKNQSMTPDNLHVFVSPEYSLLPEVSNSVCNNDNICDAGEDETNCPDDCASSGPMNWTLVVIILALLGIIILGGIFYWWYKNKYEDFLFKNKGDLRNLISFIENAQRQRLDKKQIVEKLKASGWKSSQINYAWKKVGSQRPANLPSPPRGYGSPRGFGGLNGPANANGKVLKRGPPPGYR